MSDMLRSRIIRLAHTRPDLRSHLLPLVKEAADVPVTPKVGDILYSSWGYNQTNIDFYEVSKVTGSMVVVRRLEKRIVRRERVEEYVVPVPGQYTGEPLRRKFAPDTWGGGISVSINSYAVAYSWDGTPKGQTPAGWGH
jgi:hypothetical protein